MMCKDCEKTKKALIQICELLLESTTSDQHTSNEDHEHDLFDNVDRDRIISVMNELNG